MLLTFRREQEHGVFISEKITDKEDFMYPAYQQALKALRSTIRQAELFRNGGRPEDGLGVYGYCRNIIAFSGRRGQGKTSVMLSFSRALENAFWKEEPCQDDILCRCSFTVLPPIDPTILEGDQSILAVILSRMYRLMEEALRPSACQGYSGGAGEELEEARRNDLLRQFQQCLSGINSIKFRKGREIRGLIEMQEISDSAVLKGNFDRLAAQLLETVRRDRKGLTPFLVIPLDDTDSQVQKSYEIMEDIRKYLTIPNVIILMAADLDMLRATLTQHFVQDFDTGLEREVVSIGQLRKVGSKYLDKLIPPTHTVYLPRLDDVIQQRSGSLHVRYIGQDAQGADRNLLQPSGCAAGAEALPFQESIFRYVYRKTRLVFADPKEHIHELLPTTLRGLAQFLVVFSSMQEVPEITAAAAGVSAGELARAVGRQVDILEGNLSLFEDYFLNSWIYARLSRKRAGVIGKLAAMEPEKRYASAPALLKKVYPQLGETAYPDTYDGLIACIGDLERLPLQPGDRYFLFAVRMFFDLQAHKAVAMEKRRAAARLDAKDGLLVFDFSACAGNLPGTLCAAGIGWEGLAKTLRADQYGRIVRSEEDRGPASLLLHRGGEGEYRFDPFHLIPFFLSLGSAAYADSMRGETDQAGLYQVQTSCAAIAINRDVQDAIRRAMEENAPSWDSGGDPKYLEELKKFFKMVDDAVQGINGGSPGAGPMMLSWIQGIAEFVKYDNRSGFQNLLDRLWRELSKDHMKSLCNIYRCAEDLRNTLRGTMADAGEAGEIWSAFVDLAVEYGASAYKNGFNLGRLEERLSGKPDARTAADTFWREFNRELGGLCKGLDYSVDEIRRAVKQQRQQEKQEKQKQQRRK